MEVAGICLGDRRSSIHAFVEREREREREGEREREEKNVNYRE